jgi:hypothetical protein
MADELMDVGAVAWWPLEKIVPYARNAKEHGEAQVAQLAGMIKEFGWTYPILVDEEGVILAGHKRRLACERLELTQAPVLVKTGLTAHQKQAYRIADNKTTENSPWDADLLRVELGELKEAGADLGLTGFDDEELREFFGVEEPPPPDPGPQVDRAEELREKWQVESGQMWQLGEHRLICGDCTDPAVVERVMGGERAGAVVTDSPYGINREGIENDDPEGLRALFDGCLAAMPVDDAVIINFQSPRLFPVWLDALRGAGQKFARALWMYDENDQTKPWHYWLMCSQIVIISTLGKPEWLETKAHHDTYVIGLSREWRAGGEKNDFAHASVKPVGVVGDILSHVGGIVYDPFCGSGTTLIACEQLDRKCRAVEISPAYVAVALQRWAEMTGKEPVLLDE